MIWGCFLPQRFSPRIFISIQWYKNEKLIPFVAKRHKSNWLESSSEVLAGVNVFHRNQNVPSSISIFSSDSFSPLPRTYFVKGIKSCHRYFATTEAAHTDPNKTDGHCVKNDRLKPKLWNQSRTAQNELDDEDENADFENLSELVDLQMHSSMLQQYHLEALNTQQLLVVQPDYQDKPDKRHYGDTSIDLKLAETVSLVHTLGWTVVDKLVIKSEQRNMLFKPGQLERLREHISKLESPTENKQEIKTCEKQSHRKERFHEDTEKIDKTPKFISAVFVSTFRLPSNQRLQMEEILEKPVLDRYNVVLQIFKRHAKSSEAKLQAELAEIPYLKARLHGDYEIELVSKHDPSARKGEKFFSTRRTVLSRRERKLRTEIDKVRLHRAVLRKNRTRLQIPTVAIVGYTNSGKTSLIKALTGKETLRPRNQLFATLDVTVHACRLPSTLEVLLVDTVGFISDIPTDLIASFNATLEDASLADILIHVRDVANPDNMAQDIEVKRTLRKLDLPSRLLPLEFNSTMSCENGDIGRDVITVGNKIDLIDPLHWAKLKSDGMIPVSCSKGYGLDYLLQRINSAVMKATGRRKILFKIPIENGNEEYSWLRKNAHVINVTVDPVNEQYWLADVITRQFDVERFEKEFISKRNSKNIEYEPI